MSSHAEDHEVIMIDTWKFSLRGQPEQLQYHLDDLVGEEQQRIHQGIFPELAERSIRSRLGLRWILGSYLDCQPREVPLKIGEHGKPELDPNSPLFQSLHFNLSHCGDLALMVVSWQSKLGVDLERIRLESPIEDLAQRVFAEKERETWLQSPPDKLRESFFHLWVQKEAMVKAHGDGMTLPLRHFSGISDPTTMTGAIRSDLPEIGHDIWRYHAEICAKDLRSAIVFRGKDAKIQSREPESVGLSRW